MNNKTAVAKKRNINVHSVAIYIGAVLIFVIFAILCAASGKNFVSWQNISNIIVQSSVIAIIAIGASFVILTGGIDLSVGSIVGFTGIISGLCMQAGMPVVGSLLIGVVCGTALGLANGIVISYGKVPPFIMTLGMLSIGRGMTLAVVEGMPIAGFPLELAGFANTNVFGVIPIFIIYVIIAYFIMVIVANKTKFGRHVYAVGGNRNAAHLSGIKTKRIEMMVYVLAALFGAIGGIMLLSRLSYASPTAGDGYELDAIAAVVIGGISLSGGQGKVINTLVGALILGILKCGLQMLNVSSYFQQIATGLVIVVAVFMDKAKDRKAE
ncbi:MAG: ABC transporter permease [Christensenellaceae bacterium]